MDCGRTDFFKTDNFGVELIVGGYASLARQIREETYEKMKKILIKPINIFLKAPSQKLIAEIEDLKKFPFTRYMDTDLWGTDLCKLANYFSTFYPIKIHTR